MFLPLTAGKLQRYFTSQCWKSQSHNFRGPDARQIKCWKPRVWETGCRVPEQTDHRCRWNSQERPCKAKSKTQGHRVPQAGMKVWLLRKGRNRDMFCFILESQRRREAEPQLSLVILPTKHLCRKSLPFLTAVVTG